MIEHKDGGPAFPVVGFSLDREVIYANGMTMRDYFAAKAMQGMISGYSTEFARLARTRDDLAGAVSAAAYELADMMLKERAK